MKVLVLVALTLPVTIPDGALRTPVAVEVAVHGERELDACPSIGVVATRNGARANVRVGPHKRYAVREGLQAGQEVFLCSVSPNGQWYGVVYAPNAEVECGVSSPVPTRRNYSGPCRTGWVHNSVLKVSAG